MLRSMTGFGRASKKNLVVEVQSVNRRFLEMAVYLPKELSCFEMDMRKILAKNHFRGLVTLRVSWQTDVEDLSSCMPDKKLLKNLKKNWEDIAKNLDLPTDSVDLAFLLQYIKYFPVSKQNEEFLAYKSVLEECVQKASKNLLDMKVKEGSVLQKDMKQRLQMLNDNILKIEKLSKEAPEIYQQKLKERLDKLLENVKLDPERLLQETAVLAEKTDITEEIVRFKCHVEQFFQILEKNQGVIGRKLDFFIQEMGREINTIAAKSYDAAISSIVIDCKSELEKIREQVQNIE